MKAQRVHCMYVQGPLGKLCMKPETTIPVHSESRFPFRRPRDREEVEEIDRFSGHAGSSSDTERDDFSLLAAGFFFKGYY